MDNFVVFLSFLVVLNETKLLFRALETNNDAPLKKTDGFTKKRKLKK